VTSQDITLVLSKREVVGKGLGKLKDAGLVPAVIHQPSKESLVVKGSYVDVSKVYKLAGKHHPVTVDVEGKKFLTIIKSADFEPRKHMLRHIVFGEIQQNEKVVTEVPIHFDGDSPAQKKSLLVIHQLDSVKLEAFPRDLPDSITVSVESLAEVGDKLTIADLIVPKGVTILTESEHGIAIVEETPAQVSEEAAAEEVNDSTNEETEPKTEAANE
jgi:large subunit ribosomal protein L25